MYDWLLSHESLLARAWCLAIFFIGVALRKQIPPTLVALTLVLGAIGWWPEQLLNETFNTKYSDTLRATVGIFGALTVFRLAFGFLSGPTMLLSPEFSKVRRKAATQ